MGNGYFQAPCRKRISTRQIDLDGNDLDIVVTAEPGEDPGTFDVTATLISKKTFGDVAGIAGADNATLFDAHPSESSDYGADSINAVEGSLSVVFPGVEQTEGNVNNHWKIVLTDVEVLAKDGQSFTIPVLSKTFPSPL